LVEVDVAVNVKLCGMTDWTGKFVTSRSVIAEAGAAIVSAVAAARSGTILRT
jgi:hypothetical protein